MDRILEDTFPCEASRSFGRGASWRSADHHASETECTFGTVPWALASHHSSVAWHIWGYRDLHLPQKRNFHLHQLPVAMAEVESIPIPIPIPGVPMEVDPGRQSAVLSIRPDGRPNRGDAAGHHPGQLHQPVLVDLPNSSKWSASNRPGLSQILILAVDFWKRQIHLSYDRCVNDHRGWLANCHQWQKDVNTKGLCQSIILSKRMQIKITSLFLSQSGKYLILFQDNQKNSPTELQWMTIKRVAWKQDRFERAEHRSDSSKWTANSLIDDSNIESSLRDYSAQGLAMQNHRCTGCSTNGEGERSKPTTECHSLPWFSWQFRSDGIQCYNLFIVIEWVTKQFDEWSQEKHQTDWGYQRRESLKER
jgi:hypothetical protein